MTEREKRWGESKRKRDIILSRAIPIFPFIFQQNGSVEGTYQVRTRGPHMGDILAYNNKSSLDYWGGDLCNQIEGTDGYFFRPGVDEKSTLKIFYPELCRSVYLKAFGRKMHEGVETLKFSFPEDMLEDPAVNPENVCFCSKPLTPTNDSMASCLKRGFIDYAGCKQGTSYSSAVDCVQYYTRPCFIFKLLRTF